MKPEHTKLLEAIRDVVDNLSGTWRDTRDEIINGADDLEKSALFEFVSWFETEDTVKNEDK